MCRVDEVRCDDNNQLCFTIRVVAAAKQLTKNWNIFHARYAFNRLAHILLKKTCHNEAAAARKLNDCIGSPNRKAGYRQTSCRHQIAVAVDGRNAGCKERIIGGYFTDFGGDLQIDPPLTQYKRRKSESDAKLLKLNRDNAIVLADGDRKFAASKKLCRLA